MDKLFAMHLKSLNNRRASHINLTEEPENHDPSGEYGELCHIVLKHIYDVPTVIYIYVIIRIAG